MTETRFGALLQQYRLAAGLTQEELAERARLSVRGISDLERGARGLPRKDTLQLLLQALDLSDGDQARLIAAARPLHRRCLRRGTIGTPPFPLPAHHSSGGRSKSRPSLRSSRSGTFAWSTSTGPGGTGKTRLALAVVEQVGASFPDGMVFVPLAFLADPASVAPAVAQQFRAPRNQSEQSLIDGLTDRLADHRGLLSWITSTPPPAAPLVAALLNRCPSLTVLDHESVAAAPLG